MNGHSEVEELERLYALPDPALAPRLIQKTQLWSFRNMVLGHIATPLSVNSSDFKIHFMERSFWHISMWI
jgi:hypothetical protein